MPTLYSCCAFSSNSAIVIEILAVNLSVTSVNGVVVGEFTVVLVMPTASASLPLIAVP